MSIPFTASDSHRSARYIFQLNPLQDPRWAKLVGWHPRASVFHTVGWLRALESTYGYEPVAFTTSHPTSDLENGLVFCRVSSWLTGSRMVSLPFSDHCDPLCDSPEDLGFLIRYLQTTLEHENWRYLEVRALTGSLGQTSSPEGSRPTVGYFIHVLDLHRDLGEVFRDLDKDSVRRRIRRAGRAGLAEKSGRSDDLVKEFYDLFAMTRGRHQLPPTPYTWFKNLIRCQGDAAEIRVAHHSSRPIAAIFTLRFRNILYYKYGGSDTRFNYLGAMPWLLWNAVTEAKETGATAFDMGRTQENHSGLLAFKNHWVSQPQSLRYWSFPSSPQFDSSAGWRLRTAKRVFSHMPDKLLALTGRLIYRHIG